MPKIIRLGFVGAGYMGQLAHIGNYWKLPSLEMVALAEGRPKTAALVAGAHRIQQVHGHHREMLRDADVDAVVVIVPYALNAEIVADVLDAGKHVLTEKPQANTSKAGHELVAAARRKNLVYQVGYMKRFDPGVQWARSRIAQWMDSREFGSLQSVRFWCAHGAWQWFREPVLDEGEEPARYEARLEPRPDGVTERAWRFHQDWSNYYSHQTNLARYIIGDDYRLETAKFVGRGCFVQCAFRSSGAQLYFDFPWFTVDRWDEGFEVVFERAKLTANLPAPLAKGQSARINCYEHGAAEAWSIEPSLPAADGFARQAEHFIATVRGDERPISSAAEAVKDVAFSEALALYFEQRDFFPDES